MWYVIIAIIVIILIIGLAKYVLFHPIVNSVISAIWFLCLGIMTLSAGNIFVIMLIGIMLFDCIRDIIIGKYYYENLENCIDKRFLTKSLTAIVTLGLSRAVFLLIVDPLTAHAVAAEVRRRVRCEHPLPRSGCFSTSKVKNYFYRKRIELLEKKGIVISNIETVDYEAALRRKKLDGLYPKKLLAKLADTVGGDKDTKEKRKEAEGKLQPNIISVSYAYINATTFERFPQLISEVMSKKGCCPLSAICGFEELKSLNLAVPLDVGNTQWGEYFIIQALQPLVADGTFEDEDFNDKDPLDNHAYHYAKSVKSMVSIDAGNDPRFDLDDD